LRPNRSASEVIESGRAMRAALPQGIPDSKIGEAGMDSKVNLARIRAALKGKQLTGFTPRKMRGTSLAAGRYSCAKVGRAKRGQIKKLSDVRLKQDIIHLGRLDNGINLYRYRYKWSDQVYVGVMAQEVAQIIPDAVERGTDGYLRVDYARVGLSLMTWDQWVWVDKKLAPQAGDVAWAGS
jgi:hypothetical protein